jgi:hypothetical protein
VLLECAVFKLLVVALIVAVASVGRYLGSEFHEGFICLLLHINLKAGVDVLYIVDFLKELSDELLVLCSFNKDVSVNSGLRLSLGLMSS